MYLIMWGAPVFAAPELAVGGQVSLLAWQRSGDHAALLAPVAVLTVRSARTWGFTAEVDGALAMERNADVVLVTVPLRASATADVVVRRAGGVWTMGVGPGVSMQVSELRTGSERFGGVSVRPLARARTSVEGPLSARLRWRFAAGAGLRPAGVDWDIGAGLMVLP